LGEVVAKGLTVKSLIIGILLLTMISLYVHGFTWATPTLTVAGDLWKEYGDSLLSFGYVALTALVLHGLNRIKKGFFSEQEIAVVVIMVLTGTMTFAAGRRSEGSLGRFIFGPGLGTTTRTLDLETIYENIPPFMAAGGDPSYWKTVSAAAWAPIDWSRFLPDVAWLIVFFTSLCSTFIFLAMLLRRMYVDYERLSFPVASRVVEISMLVESQQKSIYKSKYFLAGFLIQFLYAAVVNFPHLINAILQSMTVPISARALSDCMGYVGGPKGTGIYAFPDFYNVGVYPYLYDVHLHPWMIAWGIMLPKDVLIGFLVSWVVAWVIAPQILVPLGGMVGTQPSLYDNNCDPPHWALYQYIALGLIIGVGLIPLIQHRKIFGSILAGIFKEPSQEMDPDRPLPYRYVWLGLIASLIVLLSAGYAAYIPVSAFLLLIVLLMIFSIGGFRLIAETGGLLGHWIGRRDTKVLTEYTYGFLAAIALTATLGAWYKTLTPQSLMVDQILGRNLQQIVIISTFAGMCALEAQKIARLVKTRLKDALVAVLLAILVSIIVWTLGEYILIHIFPDAKVALDVKGGTAYSARDLQSTVNALSQGNTRLYNYNDHKEFATTMTADVISRIVLGIVIAAAITFLRGRFAWFTISPTGILFGFLTYINHLWASFIVALVVKQLAIKFIGTQKYQEKIHPFALGLFYGVILASILTMLLFWLTNPVGAPRGA